jgi:hypothetical protein
LLVQNTPSIPNYLSVFIGTQIVRNSWVTCKDGQLGPNLVLNKLSMELLCAQKRASNEKMWC